jgi:hypothetical protein
MIRRIFRWKWFWVLGAPLLLLALLVPAGSIYYAGAGGEACIKCHEIKPAYWAWQNSAHRDVQCAACHGSIFTTDLAFHWNNLEQLVAHVRGEVPERLLVRHADLMRGLHESCGNCHAAEYAGWKAGPHGASYERIFLHEPHNKKRFLSDHCLQCHGMFYPGGIRDLVEPVAHEGPWEIIDPTVNPTHPSIPCSACHQIHRHGVPQRERANSTDHAHGGLAFFDRREQVHFPVETLPIPALYDGTRQVRMTDDPRAALCYQCHAPDANMQVFSGDDRTPIGVHEGLSCLACHQTHTQSARNSCVSCHPGISNCGMDVMTMDTTWRSKESPHDIHRVRCSDCHGDQVPSSWRHRAEDPRERVPIPI